DADSVGVPPLLGGYARRHLALISSRALISAPATPQPQRAAQVAVGATQSEAASCSHLRAPFSSRRYASRKAVVTVRTAANASARCVIACEPAATSAA